MLVALAGGVGGAFLAGLVTRRAAESRRDRQHRRRRRVPRAATCRPISTPSPTRSPARRTSRRVGASKARPYATLDALDRYDVPTWFRLGDKDLATHLFRTQRLRGDGAPLSEVTAEITAAWGLDLRLLPMTDDRVRTRITVDPRRRRHTEELAMQEWFVGERAEPPVVSVRFDGADGSPARARCARRAAQRRHDRDLPVESGDLDRTDPRGARDPRCAGRPGVNGCRVSARSSAARR